MTPTARRLDTVLVERGLARSRTQAKSLIRDGCVQVDGRLEDKASTSIGPEQQIVVQEAATGSDAGWITAGWVGRAAVKLEEAVRRWEPEGLQIEGRRCLDIGASTGGFTQVLLAHGAEHVVALDVGHGQLVPELAQHPDVTDVPGTNIRDVRPGALGAAFGVVVSDVSFISLRHVLPVIPDLAADDADVVVLVKPQFEVGPERLGRDGVVRSVAFRHQALHTVIDQAGAVGLVPFGVARSPIVGGSGNVEYLLWLRPRRPDMMNWGLSPEQLAKDCASLRLEEET